MSDRSMEAELATWGKVILLQTTGRRSGRPRTVAVGFIDVRGRDGSDVRDGSLLVAAASATTSWAANLRADPRCVVELDGVRRAFVARALGPAERAATIAQLILKYGTPAERLGAGPAFELEPRP